MTSASYPLRGPELLPWYRFAQKYSGQNERLVSGEPNPFVEECFQFTGFKQGTAKDPWCSAFLNRAFAEAGMKGTGKANARSWLQWGEECDEVPGCVVVFSRPPSPTAGHVALLVYAAPEFLYVLGGNQANRVCLRKYPRARLLGCRWPSNFPFPEDA